MIILLYAFYIYGVKLIFILWWSYQKLRLVTLKGQLIDNLRKPTKWVIKPAKWIISFLSAKSYREYNLSNLEKPLNICTTIHNLSTSK